MKNVVKLIPIYREKYLRQIPVSKTLLEIIRPLALGLRMTTGMFDNI